MQVAASRRMSPIACRDVHGHAAILGESTCSLRPPVDAMRGLAHAVTVFLREPQGPLIYLRSQCCALRMCCQDLTDQNVVCNSSRSMEPSIPGAHFHMRKGVSALHGTARQRCISLVKCLGFVKWDLAVVPIRTAQQSTTQQHAAARADFGQSGRRFLTFTQRYVLE